MRTIQATPNQRRAFEIFAQLDGVIPNEKLQAKLVEARAASTFKGAQTVIRTFCDRYKRFRGIRLLEQVRDAKDGSVGFRYVGDHSEDSHAH